MVTSAKHPLPQFQEFHIDGVQHIASEDAFKLLISDAAVMLDVREPEEWNTEKFGVTDIIYIPLVKVINSLDKIPKDKMVIVACRAGIRSSKIANLLRYQGFPDTANLDGGMLKWVESGLPVACKPVRGCSCGCSCGN